MKKKNVESSPVRVVITAAALAGLCAFVPPSFAQDAVNADPQHYKVEFENAAVRVLRVVYGPGEKSPLHGHPAAVAVYLTDGHLRITWPDGRVGEPFVKAGQTMWHTAGQHVIENLGDAPFELVLTEMKTQAPPATGK